MVQLKVFMYMFQQQYLNRACNKFIDILLDINFTIIYGGMYEHNGLSL